MRNGLGLAQAFRTITIIPAKGPDAKKSSTQLHFYPLVGLVIGTLGCLLECLLLFLCERFGFSSSEGGAASTLPHSGNLPGTIYLVLGVVWTCYMAFVTRGFHLDGLGDTADGFGGGWTKERRLEIMKDSRSGSFAVVAIALCLVLKAATAALALQKGMILALLCSCVLSRYQVVLMSCLCNYAKNQGLSYDLVTGAGAVHVLSCTVQVGVSGLGLWYIGGSMACFVVQALFSTFSMAILAIVSRKKIGGVTGDVLGACCEVSEAMSLVCVLFVK